MRDLRYYLLKERVGWIKARATQSFDLETLYQMGVEESNNLLIGLERRLGRQHIERQSKELIVANRYERCKTLERLGVEFNPEYVFRTPYRDSCHYLNGIEAEAVAEGLGGEHRPSTVIIDDPTFERASEIMWGTPTLREFFSGEPSDWHEESPTPARETPISLNDYEAFGIEVELEFDGALPRSSPSYWVKVPDGSLRNGVEYVLKRPVAFSQVPTAVNTLYNYLEKRELSIQETGRAGVHVHRNLSGITHKQLAKVLKYYYAIEDSLISWCGEERKSNYYCVPASEGAYMLISAVKFVVSKRYNFDKSLSKYSALNLCAIRDHGSIEFRMMRSSSKAQDIIDFVGKVNTLFNTALEGKLDHLRGEEFVVALAKELDLPLNKEDLLLGVVNFAEFEVFYDINDLEIVTNLNDGDTERREMNDRYRLFPS